MNTRTAAMVAITASLTVLLSGCGGAAADTGGSAELGLARGRVMVADEFTRTAPRDASVRATEARAWSADALREFHGAQATAPTGRAGWSAEARREFHGAQATAAASRAGWSDEVVRELKGSESLPTPRAFTAEEMRELKGSSSGAGGGR